MDRRATKDHVERETEETERLVRPSPKVKPPRHDKRRELVDPDKDPDLDTSDKDLSKNFKDIGGSIGDRVLKRWAADEAPAKPKKVKVRSKETGWVGWISEDSLKSHAGDYEPVKDEAPEVQKPSGPEKAEAPQAPTEAKPEAAPPIDDAKAKVDLLSLGKKNHQVEWTLNNLMDPNGVLGHFADKYPAESLLQGQKLPDGIKTVGDLRRVLRSESESAPEEKPPEKTKGKKTKSPKKPKVEESVAEHPDLKKEQAEAVDRIKAVKEELKEDPKSEGAKAELAAQKEVLKSISEVSKLRKQLDEAKAQLDAFNAANKPPAQAPPATQAPAAPAPAAPAAPAPTAPAASPAPTAAPAGKPKAEKPKSKKDKAPKGSPVPPPPAGKGTTPPAAPAEEPKPEAETPDGETQNPEVAPGPQRRPVSKAEEHAAINLIVHSFPPGVAAKLTLLDPPLHPDDVHALISDYNVAKSISVPTGKLDELRDKAAKFYATDPSTVPPPKLVKNKHGFPVPFDKLPAEEQTEELRKHQIRTVAMSLAAKDAISKNLQKKAKAPAPLAEAMADFMLSGKEESPDERTMRASQKAESLFYNTIGAIKEVEPQDNQPPKSATQESAPASSSPGSGGKSDKKAPEKRPKERNRFDQESTPKQEEYPPVSPGMVKKILKSSSDPAVKRLAVGYFQAQDYKQARKLFLDPRSPSAMSEHQAPDEIAGNLIKASEFLRDRASNYPANLITQDTAQTFRGRVLKQLSTLAPTKMAKVQELLDEDDNQQYDKAVKAYPKVLREYSKHSAKAEKEADSDYADYSEQLKKGGKDLDPPLSAAERLERMGIVEPQEPKKPPRYDLTRSSSEDLGKDAKAMWDDFTTKTASSGNIVSRVLNRTQGHPFSTYSNPSAMGRTAVYWGVAPQDTKPYEGWEQPQARDLGESDYSLVLKAARGWLKNPMLKTVEGGVRDTQLRAALDLALREENYDAALHPVLYNHLLARLAGVPEDETLLTVTASKTARNPMSNKVELEIAQADKFLARLDRIASVVQENHAKWGMEFEAAKALVNQIDKLADEIESATYGVDSMTRRQASVLGVKTAEVVQRDSDEKYMDTFKNPMSPKQTEADEPYMKAYGDDQSSAVHHGKSSTGKPLAK